MGDKLSGLLGLARRAGKLIWGSDAVIREITGGEAVLVLLSADVSERTAEAVDEACRRADKKLLRLPLDKAALGHAIGRGETAVAAVSDKAFSAGIEEICRKNTGGIC